MLMPLVLDDYAEPEERAQAEAYARQCGLLRDRDDRPCYTVMVSTLLDEEGANCTAPSFVASVDTLAAKYLRSVSFFASGRKVISVLLGNPSDFEEYLHILADEIPQMAARVLGRRCRIGVSRMVRDACPPCTAPTGRPWKPCVRAIRSEGGAQFISDLAPAAKGGQPAVQPGAGCSGSALYGRRPVPGLPQRACWT